MRASELAEHHHNLGGAHKIAGRLKEAEAEFRRALELDPTRATTKYSLATTLLAMGSYKEGYKLYESRHEIVDFRNPKPKLPFPEWDGSVYFGQKILIWPEQGFGDQIQSARFSQSLRNMGAEVTILCAPALARLFSSLEVNVVPASGSTEFPDPDGWVMCESIAGRLGIEVNDIPNKPYLRLRGNPAPRAGRIGIATQGDPRHTNDRYRSLFGRDAERLRSLPYEIIDLNPNSTGARDFFDTAELISELDLVISVDTSVAHLCGALGRECWVLIPNFNTDWRWLRDRIDSPWYPSLRLFRQEEAGNWKETIDHIEDELITKYR